MNKKFCSLLFVASIIMGCGDQESVEQKIRLQIKNDLPQLAVMQAVYLAEYSNFSDGGIFPDDFFIKKVRESRYYGLELDDVLKDLEIKDKKLSVKVPFPKRLSTTEDRKSIITIRKNESTIPKENGNPVNVSEKMTKDIDAQEAKLNSAIISDAKKYTKFYFDSLASRYGLKSDFRFRDE